MYSDIYNLLLNGIYGDIVLTPDMSLTLTLLSTLACIFVIALPFILVWRIIKIIC